MLMWPEEMKKFKWRTTGRQEKQSVTLCCLFKADEDEAQQFHTKNCLYQPTRNLKFPAWVIF